MSAINELKEGLEQTQTAEFVTTMLRDISATKLQTIRRQFEANQRYFAELHELMALVQAYAREMEVKLEQAPKERVYVAITSNKRFYGNLNHEIVRSLHGILLKDSTADCIVVGQTGQQIVSVNPLPKSPQSIVFQKDDPTEDELYGLIEVLRVYEEVLVVHPTFINSFQQNAKTTDITHLPKTEDESKQTAALEYLFEPDIPKIAEFFKTQIRMTLFMRVLLETQVAFTGARLMKMQRAREKAGEMVKQQELVIHKQTSTVKNMRLLETFTGFNKKML